MISTQQPNFPMPAGVLQRSLFPVPPTNKTDRQALTRRQFSIETDNFRYSHCIPVSLGTLSEIGTAHQRVIVEPDTRSILL